MQIFLHRKLFISLLVVFCQITSAAPSFALAPQSPFTDGATYYLFVNEEVAEHVRGLPEDFITDLFSATSNYRLLGGSSMIFLTERIAWLCETYGIEISAKSVQTMGEQIIVEMFIRIGQNDVQIVISNNAVAGEGLLRVGTYREDTNDENFGRFMRAGHSSAGGLFVFNGDSHDARDVQKAKVYARKARNKGFAVISAEQTVDERDIVKSILNSIYAERNRGAAVNYRNTREAFDQLRTLFNDDASVHIILQYFDNNYGFNVYGCTQDPINYIVSKVTDLMHRHLAGHRNKLMLVIKCADTVSRRGGVFKGILDRMSKMDQVYVCIFSTLGVARIDRSLRVQPAIAKAMTAANYAVVDDDGDPLVSIWDVQDLVNNSMSGMSAEDLGLRFSVVNWRKLRENMSALRGAINGDFSPNGIIAGCQKFKEGLAAQERGISFFIESFRDRGVTISREDGENIYRLFGHLLAFGNMFTTQNLFYCIKNIFGWHSLGSKDLGKYITLLVKGGFIEEYVVKGKVQGYRVTRQEDRSWYLIANDSREETAGFYSLNPEYLENEYARLIEFIAANAVSRHGVRGYQHITGENNQERLSGLYDYLCGLGDEYFDKNGICHAANVLHSYMEMCVSCGRTELLSDSFIELYVFFQTKAGDVMWSTDNSFRHPAEALKYYRRSVRVLENKYESAKGKGDEIDFSKFSRLPNLYTQIGWCYEGLSEYSKQVEYLVSKEETVLGIYNGILLSDGGVVFADTGNYYTAIANGMLKTFNYDGVKRFSTARIEFYRKVKDANPEMSDEINRLIARTYNIMGWACFQLGKINEAIQNFSNAIDAAVRGNEDIVSWANHGKARCQIYIGANADKSQLKGTALTVAENLLRDTVIPLAQAKIDIGEEGRLTDPRRDKMDFLIDYGVALLENGKLDDADSKLTEAWQLAKELSNTTGKVESLIFMAKCELASDTIALAKQHCEMVLREFVLLNEHADLSRVDVQNFDRLSELVQDQFDRMEAFFITYLKALLMTGEQAQFDVVSDVAIRFIDNRIGMLSGRTGTEFLSHALNRAKGRINGLATRVVLIDRRPSAAIEASV